MKTVTFKTISTVVSHHMLRLLLAGACNLWRCGDAQEATGLWSGRRCGTVHQAPESPGLERQRVPHLPCWKAMSRRNCCDVCWARAAREGGAVPFVLCKITCFGSLFWPFGCLLLPWPLERNSVTEGGSNALQPQEGDLKRGAGTLTQDFLAPVSLQCCL